MNIGIFDSGIGGLTVLKEFLRALPSYNYVYAADKANVPYGGKKDEEIYRLTQKGVEFLFKKGSKLVILACNTATAAALKRLQREYLPRYYPDRKILGVILPICEEIVESGARRVGVMATEATVRSNSFEKEIKKAGGSVELYQQACPRLVPLIEKGHLEWDGTDALLNKYLSPLIEKHIDTLVLGCTHFAVVEQAIRKALGSRVRVFSAGPVVAHKLKDYLSRHNELNKELGQRGECSYYFSALTPTYERLVKLFLKGFISEHTRLNKVAF